MRNPRDFHFLSRQKLQFFKLGFLCCMLVAAVCSQAAESGYQPPLRVGINKAMPPFSFFDRSLEHYRGFCVDLVRLLGAELHRSIRFVPMDPLSLPIALSEGEIDAVCGHVEFTEDWNRFHTIDTTVKIETGFFVNSDCMTVTCAKDLSGQIVVTEKGRSVRQFVADSQAVRFIETENPEAALAMVNTGFAMAYISSNAMTTWYLIQKNRFENIKEIGLPLNTVPLSVILRKTDASLISQMSFAYGKLVQSGKYQILRDKWLGKQFGLNLWDRYFKYLAGIMTAVGSILIILVYMNRSLKRRVRRITQDLQLSEKRYRELIESSPDMITLTDPEGVILLANQKCRDILGYGSDEMASLSMPDLVEDAFSKEMRNLVVRLFHEGTASGSFRVRDKRGGSIYLEVVARTIRHEIGEREMACFFCRDITQRKQLEEELIQSERMAVMGQTAAGLAHEINNPLGIILANTEEVLYGESTPNEDRECLLTIERNAMRAAKIIENLLSFTRPGLSKKSQVDATQLIDETIFFLRQKLKKGHVQVETCYEKIPFMIFADENQFQQLVINLMLNSIEAMPEEGDLQVTLKTEMRREAPTMVLSVKDNGSGIPEEELAKIFNPFFTAGKRNGFGLGLFICKGIVEKHGGNLSAVSKKGKGTTMRVEMPLAVGCGSESGEPRIDGSPPDGSPLVRQKLRRGNA